MRALLALALACASFSCASKSADKCREEHASLSGEKQREAVYQCLLRPEGARPARPPAKPAAPPPRIPASWAEFIASTQPEDRRVVARVQKLEWYDACLAWGREVRAKKDDRYRLALVYFLQSEQLISGLDLSNVTSARPVVGMTFCGVFAQLGQPDRVNQTQRASGRSAQLVYRSRGIYVYTEGKDANGVVRSIQF